MNALFLLLLFPLAWPFIAKRIWHSSINYQEMGLSIVIAAIVVTGTWQAGKWGATQDTEVWNGYVTKKEMVDDYYQTSYECNCTTSTDSQGNSSTSCQTCYTDHYTREYNGHSTVGNWTFASIDSEWRMRRDAFGPTPAYTNCTVGEPASIEHSYVNYVQAVPQSLFHDDSTVQDQFAGKIPAYPRVYNFYKYNRVINVGSTVPAELQKMVSSQLDDALKTLGAQKQVNVIVILTDILDPTYRYAIENAWLGAEKNDVVIMLGMNKDNTFAWVDVMTWALNSGNELFHVTLRDKLQELGNANDATLLSTAITGTIATTYDRPHMADYEYLAEEVTPPTWVIYLAVFLSFGVPIGLTVLFHFKEVDFLGHRGYNRFRNRRY